LEKHNQELEEECGRLGIDFYSVSSETPIFDVFYEILR